MGTRSITHVYEQDTDTKPAQPIVSIYQQYDGYPEGVGATLCKFMEGLKIVNGMSGDPVRVANGAGCFAAQLIAHLKKAPGGVYIYPPGASDEEFVYRIYIKSPQGFRGSSSILLEVYDGDSTKPPLFSGTPAEVAAAIAKPEADS